MTETSQINEILACENGFYNISRALINKIHFKNSLKLITYKGKTCSSFTVINVKDRTPGTLLIRYVSNLSSSLVLK